MPIGLLVFQEMLQVMESSTFHLRIDDFLNPLESIVKSSDIVSERQVMMIKLSMIFKAQYL